MLARNTRSPATAWRPEAPRRAFWALLTGALILSLALPLVTLWRASAASGLTARACMWPAEPRAGAPAQVLIVAPGSAGRALEQAGALAVQVVATMPAMTMQTDEASAAGTAKHLQGATVFTAPLTVSMPGSWVAHITVRATDGPVWSGALVFQARASGWDALPLSAQPAGAAQLCAAPTTALSQSLAGATYQPPAVRQVTAWLH